jgi:hypothetical protein
MHEEDEGDNERSKHKDEIYSTYNSPPPLIYQYVIPFFMLMIVLENLEELAKFEKGGSEYSYVVLTVSELIKPASAAFANHEFSSQVNQLLDLLRPLELSKLLVPGYFTTFKQVSLILLATYMVTARL